MIYEIISDGRVVWVNSDDGMCIGRFSGRGIDVHADAKSQMSGAVCLDCISGIPFGEAWNYFKKSMLEHHKCIIGDEHRPIDLAAGGRLYYKPGNHCGFSNYLNKGGVRVVTK